MKATLYNQSAESVGTVTLSDRVFGVPMNYDLLHQVVTSQLANKRQVIAHAKTRAEVRGGGRKPWRQKGTGRARHGSIRSPIWKGGGVSGGPTKERNFSKKINKKMMRRALEVALSAKVRDGQFAIIDTLSIEPLKTKTMAQTLRTLMSIFHNDAPKKDMQSILVLVPSEIQKGTYRTIQNIPNTGMMEARNVNPLALLSYQYVIATKDTVPVLTKES